ncbi:DeoR family transcriptional regulator [Pedobacter sp. HMF7647]|uniref:DeoR family transcriptional regulator n=1 Tax=Hufsiella arboris TaxID=2695275 RepID=A0A7K1Y4N2_9SPHI|nr:DeoR/GlpR family DNA-binding transcription regulator [Hufsiella arboris]MXV49532.1 DeoR family transcriptional regulator [Hufsiella arboris]
MLKRERHAFIIKQINLHNKVLSSDLSIQLNVSEDTIRRDLNELSEDDKILKVHGGALSKSFHSPYLQNEIYAHQSKKAIAQKSISLLHDGMSVLTGGGTTMNELARAIPDSLKATFFTISPTVAIQLAEHPQLTVILIGGQLSKDAQVNLGSKTVSELNEIRVDLCFLGANGIDWQEGMTDSDWEVVQIKKAMIKASSKLAVISIAEKLNSVQKLKVCPAGSVSYLVTDMESSAAELQPYIDNGINVL